MLDPNMYDNDFFNYLPHHHDYNDNYYRGDNFDHPHKYDDFIKDNYDDYYWWNHMRHPYYYGNYYYDRDYRRHPYFHMYPHGKSDVIQTLAPIGDPPPKLSNNPQNTSIALTKELTGYPNYGNPSGNADILYKGNKGSWTFVIPTIAFTTSNTRGTLLISANLDDHNDVAVKNYSAKITVNGFVVHDGILPLEHGRPLGGKFDNWNILKFNMPSVRKNSRITIENTSKTGDNDFIALDYIEIKLS